MGAVCSFLVRTSFGYWGLRFLWDDAKPNQNSASVEDSVQRFE